MKTKIKICEYNAIRKYLIDTGASSEWADKLIREIYDVKKQYPEKLTVDTKRFDDVPDGINTGYYVRAWNPDAKKWESTDIIYLTRESLNRWLGKYDKHEIIGIIEKLFGYGVIE